MRLWAQGITSASPSPFIVVKQHACTRLVDVETPIVHTDQMKAPIAIMIVLSDESPRTPLQVTPKLG